MKCKPIEEIKAFLEPFAEEQGIEIYDIEFKAGKEPALTVYIDKEGGVDLNTCEAFHHAIDEPLDTLDPTYGEQYTLNVSSPGLAFKNRQRLRAGKRQESGSKAVCADERQEVFRSGFRRFYGNLRDSEYGKGNGKNRTGENRADQRSNRFRLSRRIR